MDGAPHVTHTTPTREQELVLRLTTFGGLSVESDRGVLASTTAHRRRIALLPLLAVARGRGVSRDKIVAYLWPESDTERARHALTQTLYALRHDLGADVIVADAMELRLEVSAMSSDVGTFEDALEKGRFAPAVDLYRGPFLDGFHLRDAPEFERWVDMERSRFAAQVCHALEELAGAAARRGDSRLCVQWWRRLASLDPLSARVAVGLMTALAHAGDPGGALQHARIHELLLRQELAVAPDAAVTTLVARLREETATARPALLGDAQVASTVQLTGVPASLRAENAPDAAEFFLERLRRALAGRYTVIRELDRSSSVTTFLARPAAHGSDVALLVLEPMLVAHMDVELFVDAIRGVQRLTHPNIVQVLDAGATSGVVFCVLQHLDGETLRDRLKREKQLPIDDAVRIACELADALDHAHALGLVHRHLKPRNVWLAHETSLLNNFGIAAAISAATRLATPSGFLLGSPPYMSPEQLAGETEFDGRSDLYSLGCVLFEMLVGVTPLAGTSPQGVLAMRWTSAAPKLRLLRDSVPPQVETAVAKALARFPADRFRTGSEFRGALGTC